MDNLNIKIVQDLTPKTPNVQKEKQYSDMSEKELKGQCSKMKIPKEKWDNLGKEGLIELLTASALIS